MAESERKQGGLMCRDAVPRPANWLNILMVPRPGRVAEIQRTAFGTDFGRSPGTN